MVSIEENYYTPTVAFVSNILNLSLSGKLLVLVGLSKDSLACAGSYFHCIEK